MSVNTRVSDTSEAKSKKSNDSAGLNAPQAEFIAGVAAGKSQYQVAVDAGHAPSTARNPEPAIEDANGRKEWS